MRAHLRDLRDVERLLIAGKLDDAKTRAYLLTKPASDFGMSRWQREVDAVSEGARSLDAATSVEQALRVEVQIAAACARCHVRTQTLPVIAEPAAAPADDGTPSARMARHEWAVDRLWEGVVSGSEHHWRLGLDILATTPLPQTVLAGGHTFAARLHGQARHELAVQTIESPENRARAYGEILVTCSACHRDHRCASPSASCWRAWVTPEELDGLLGVPTTR